MPYHLPSSPLNLFTKELRLCLLKELSSGNVILPFYFENPPEAFVVKHIYSFLSINRDKKNVFHFSFEQLLSAKEQRANLFFSLIEVYK